MSKWVAAAAFGFLAGGFALPALAAPCVKGSPDTCTITIERNGKPAQLTLRQFRQLQQQELRQLQDRSADERAGLNQGLHDLMQQDREKSDEAAADQRSRAAAQVATATDRRQACLGACALPAGCQPAPASVPPGIPVSTYCSANQAQCQAACRKP